jgi:hypothetical protein
MEFNHPDYSDKELDKAVKEMYRKMAVRGADVYVDDVITRDGPIQTFYRFRQVTLGRPAAKAVAMHLLLEVLELAAVCLVLSRGLVTPVSPNHEDLRCMWGFIDRAGRLPIPGDVFSPIFFPSRAMKCRGSHRSPWEIRISDKAESLSFDVSVRLYVGLRITHLADGREIPQWKI